MAVLIFNDCKDKTSPPPPPRDSHAPPAIPVAERRHHRGVCNGTHVVVALASVPTCPLKASSSFSFTLVFSPRHSCACSFFSPLSNTFGRKIPMTQVRRGRRCTLCQRMICELKDVLTVQTEVGSHGFPSAPCCAADRHRRNKRSVTLTQHKKSGHLFHSNFLPLSAATNVAANGFICP